MRSVRLAVPVLVLAALALTGCQPEPGPGETSAAPSAVETPDAQPSSEPSAATPTGEPDPTATPGGDSLPDDCAQAYSADMYERLLAFGELNPDVTYFSSNVGDVNDVIQGSPTLACLWISPEDSAVAMKTTASLISEAHAALLRESLPENFPGCDESAERFSCTREREQTQGAVETETVVLQGDLLVATLGLNAGSELVDEATSDLLAVVGG
ncbi:hypothetical protein [Microbacterium marinilacus]|uniref:DUF3558 domain-containing protein n=1 Tax=Microbacterium marinilacus TaxID=415209 RepID=A0ABP7BMI9_9MICO|nr:hypothetical protein [Microbacterium marinilacus]MBY0689910.1 hypothetical protein [Microbacterium marinilacus]